MGVKTLDFGATACLQLLKFVDPVLRSEMFLDSSGAFVAKKEQGLKISVNQQCKNYDFVHI